MILGLSVFFLSLFSVSILEEGRKTIEISLEEFRWRNRLLLMSAASATDKSLVEQSRRLSGKDYELKDRDLKIIQITSSGASLIDGAKLGQESSAAIRRQFELPLDTFQVLLIGKDGTVKLRSDEPVTSDRIFSLIDSMPMRQREIRDP